MLMRLPGDRPVPIAPGLRVLAPRARLSTRRAASSRLRRLGVVSLGLHAALLALVVFWHRPRPSEQAPESPGAIELVMLEQRGSGPTTLPQDAAPPVAASPMPPPPPDDATAEPLPQPPSGPQAAGVPAETPAPVPPEARPQDALQINIGGTDSETNAIVSGPGVIPARLDAKFRNRGPIYPQTAVNRAEQGAVILLIHVSPEGLATSVDIAQSSGYALLDNAARDAAMGWRFVPAVTDGQAVPFDMPFKFVFQLQLR